MFQEEVRHMYTNLAIRSISFGEQDFNDSSRQYPLGKIVKRILEG